MSSIRILPIMRRDSGWASFWHNSLQKSLSSSLLTSPISDRMLSWTSSGSSVQVLERQGSSCNDGGYPILKTSTCNHRVRRRHSWQSRNQRARGKGLWLITASWILVTVSRLRRAVTSSPQSQMKWSSHLALWLSITWSILSKLKSRPHTVTSRLIPAKCQPN